MTNWILIVLCILCWSVWPLMMKFALSSISPIMIQVVIAYVYSMFAPAMFLYMKATGIAVEWSTKGIIYATIACTLSAAASLSFSTVIQRVPVNIVGSFTAIYPVITFLLSVIFLGESVTIMKFMGIMTIAVGIVLLSL